MDGGRARRRGIALLASVAVVAVVSAAPVGAASRQESGRVERICPAPRPGLATCSAWRVVASGAAAPGVTAGGFGPADLDAAYRVPTALGAGRTVAIVVSNDDPHAEADLASYRTQFGLPACTVANGCFAKVNQLGNPSPLPAADTGWAGDIALNIDMVSATCPLCHILLVEASNPTTANMGTANNTAATLGAVAIANPWGGIEDSTGPSADHYFNHPGVAVTAAGGDEGYGAEWPASSPYVVAVGGTTLTKDATTARGWSERVWHQNADEATASGCSSYEPKPAWQRDAGCAKRTANDVAVVADPNTGVAVYDTFGGSGWAVYGGTEVGAPIVASLFAMARPATADVNPAQYLYANPAALFDVTVGNTATCSPAYLCTAEVGYDGPTGLGTPNGIDAFSPAPILTPSLKSGSAGQTLVVTGTGFPGGDRVRVRYQTGLASPKLVTLCTTKVGRDGAFDCKVTIPTADAGAPGRHRVSALDLVDPMLPVAATSFRLK